MTDEQLEAKIEDLKSLIHSWAEKHDLWHDAGFKTWSEHFDDEPRENPSVLLMWFEGPLYKIFNGYSNSNLEDEFWQLIKSTKFNFDMYEHTLMTFYTEDETLKNLYKDYFEWHWILDLITPDYSDLYEELFQRFAKNPDDLYRLAPRKFEVLLDAIFRNNGFVTELGPGQGDGGVDIRLYSNDIISEAVTLVQAKRYASNRPIRLEAVQALSAAVEDERANRGLFVSTSRFLPSAQKFAARQNRRIKLATSQDVQKWANYAANRIIRDKSTLVSTSHVRSVLDGTSRGGLIGKVFHASTDYNTTNNEFALVLKETKGAALLMRLPKAVINDDGYGQSGYHVPVLDGSALKHLHKDYVFRAKKKLRENSELYLWGDHDLYTLWDGDPKFFDHCD